MPFQSPFSFNFAGNGKGETAPPRMGAYPIDLDGSLRYTRPALGCTEWPDPATYPNNAGIGCVSGLLPQMDAFVYQQMVARIPWGPLIDAVPPNPTRYMGQIVLNMGQVGDPNANTLKL